MTPATLLPGPKFDGPAAPDTPRKKAFCALDAAEVFASVVPVPSIGRPDPLDVETIHAKARDLFAGLFNRAAGNPDGGRAFLLKGVAGSGKTHLMRAFRQYAHARGGYCGYMQMISHADAFSVYVLRNLVDSLAQPYQHPAAQSGLARLARGILDGLVGETATAEEVENFCHDWPADPNEVVTKVERFADLAMQDRRRHFDDKDLDLVRALLYCLPEDRLYRSRALKWLRAEELSPNDRSRLGGLPSRTGDAAAFELVQGFGRVMAAVDHAPLVILADQLEETMNATSDRAELERRVRHAVDALVNVAMNVPNAVVVVACLAAFYNDIADKLPQSKRDRLEHDPPAVVLTAQRDADEVEAILRLRLAHLFESQGVAVDPAAPLDPFEPGHLRKLAGSTSRTVIQWLSNHQKLCIGRGHWVDPEIEPTKETDGVGGTTRTGKDKAGVVELDQLWGDFTTNHPTPTLDEESDRAKLLAFGLAAASAELPAGVTVGATPHERFVEVDVNLPGNAADRVVAAVCDRSARGSGLRGQVDEVESRAGEHPVALVRSTVFPGPNTQVGQVVLKLTGPKTKGRRVVVSEQEWLTLDAFRAFHKLHAGRPDFAAWQRGAKPLSELKAVRDVLKLGDLAEKLRELPPVVPPPPPPAVGVTKPPLRVVPPAGPPPAGGLALGVGRGALAQEVSLPPVGLRQHMAFLGGSGSGKTTAALVLVEQLLQRGVPALLLDRKGDLARYADPAAFSAGDARDPDRARLRDAVDVQLFTPGNGAGRGLRLPVAPDGLDKLTTADREDQLNQTAAAVVGMLGGSGKGPDARQVILAKALGVLAKDSARPVTLKLVRELIGEQDDSLTAELSNYDAKHYAKLATDLQTLEGLHHRLFTDGDPLDPDMLFGRKQFAVPGKTRLSIVNTQFLGDKARVDFWVAQLLLALSRWAAKNPSPDALQAVVLLDEADQYLPAVGKPATKAPAEHLLKRARSAGVGLLLATQSPGDFDYKCRDQITTWLVGRVQEQTAQNKLKAVLGNRQEVLNKLAKQQAGQFYLAREGEPQAVQTGRSLVETRQLPEERVLELARATAPRSGE